MTCTITVFDKDDGKTYIGLINSIFMGKMFGVGNIMGKVAKDRQQITTFN